MFKLIKPFKKIYKTVSIIYILLLTLSLNTSLANNTLLESRVESDNKVRPEIEGKRKQAEEEAQKTMIHDAVKAIEHTQEAIDAITKQQENEAIAAIERAIGKTDILLARYPENALLPVGYTVDIIDAAPIEIKIIKEINNDIKRIINNKDYPAARVLLDSLQSEIRVRIYNLPLPFYHNALKEAAYLTKNKKTNEASNVLLRAINTLFIADNIIPIPVVNVEIELEIAETNYEKNPDYALKILANAKNELKRSKELGYIGNDPDYVNLNNAIEDLEKQIKSKKGSKSAFTTLKEKLHNFLKHQSEPKKRGS